MPLAVNIATQPLPLSKAGGGRACPQRRPDLTDDDKFATWLKDRRGGVHVPVRIASDSDEADEVYYVAKTVGAPMQVRDTDLVDGHNTYKIGTWVVELQWYRLVDTLADGSRVYHVDRSTRNDVYDLGSLFRFNRLELDRDDFKLTFKRGRGWMLSGALHERVLDHLVM